ncbi:unnamed protein product [Ophioblennius macclurei]
MTLRRPAAHLRRAPGWRRSGDESCWEGLIPEGERSPAAPRPTRTPRPQSAIEGGQLDSWLEHLQTLQSQLRAPDHDQVLAFNERTTSMPVLNKEPSGRAWRQKCFPSFSRPSSSCGSSSICESSLGSQESLQTGFISPPEPAGNWERAHMMQAPSKEQTQLSHLAPVKIGWLPIQRRVMMVDDANKQEQYLDHVKMKQPITPTFHTTQVTIKSQDGEAERSHSSPSALAAKTWQTPDQTSPIDKQVPEKQNLVSKGGEKPAGWQALRSRWNTNRVLAFPGGGKSKELPTGTGSDPNTKSPLTKTTSAEAFEASPPNRTTSADFHRPPTLPQGANATATCKPQNPLRRTSGIQPVKAIIPLCETGSIQTSSAVTTLIPQNRTGFSSITISSRKVCRSSSLPGSGNTSSQSSRSPSPPVNHHSAMDPGQITVQRKATIVKVTEKRVMASPGSARRGAGGPPTDYAVDTVVHRRKATIIKVTEHRESYSPAQARCSHPEYRHSYTEGLHHNKSSQSSAAPPQHQVGSRQNSAAAPNAMSANLENNSTMHRSTLSLILSNTPAIEAPASSEVSSSKAFGRRSARPHRPLSWYGNAIGHAEPCKEETATRPVARKWSFGPSQETGVNPVNPRSSFVSQEKAAKEAGRPVTDTLKPNGANKGEKDKISIRPEDTMRTVSPSLTLIKAPDPRSNQSPDQVLALNAAAIIANIKLQRQLGKKTTTTTNGDLEKDSAASPAGNTDGRKCMKSPPDQSKVQRHNLAGFVPLNPGAERSDEPVSLQQALKRSRPDFISRSQGRVRRLERKAQERRELSRSADLQSDAALRQRMAHGARSGSLNDNPFIVADRPNNWKDMQSRSQQTLAETKRIKDEAKKREACVSNRQRVELFKKKLLAQVLQKGNN